MIGAEGKPAPTEATVTGGSQAGAAQFGLTQYQAILRAEKRAPELRKTDTTWSKGCTPQQAGGCIYGTWYLIEPKHEKVLRGPEETKGNLFAEEKAKPSPNVRAVRINPGTVVVRARAVETASGKVTNKTPNSWYVIKDDPVLTGADVKNPTQSFDEGAGGIGRPERHVRLHRTRPERLSERHQGNRPPRPGSAAAGRGQGSRPAALRGGARRTG